jgi:magnesium transporter
MIDRYVHKKLTWLDVINPTNEEVRELIDECGIPHEFTTDLTTTTPRTETFAKKGALKITLDIPIVRRTDIDHPHEIKFIVTKTHLVTIRFEDIEAMHRFAKEFEVFCMLKQKKTNPSSITLFFTLLSYLYTEMDTKLDYIESRLKDIEKGIFADQEKEMVFEISHVMRRLIDFRQTIGAHEKALSHLHDCVKTAFVGKFDEAIIDLEHHYRHVNRNVFALISTTEDLRDTNNALLTTKQNEVMKMFTILAFITFPLTLFTSMFGMNTVTTPIVGNPGDFWIILGTMAVVSIAFFAYFKYRKWF